MWTRVRRQPRFAGEKMGFVNISLPPELYLIFTGSLAKVQALPLQLSLDICTRNEHMLQDSFPLTSMFACGPVLLQYYRGGHYLDLVSCWCWLCVTVSGSLCAN